MNNFIAAVIVLPFLLFFPLQYGLQMTNHAHIVQMEAVVEAAKEQVKQEGCFTAAITDQMKSDLIKKYKGLAADEIRIEVTTVPKYRTDSFDARELINYKIGIPIKAITAAHKMFHISDAENKGIYYLEGSVASERLMPGEEP